MFFSLVSSRFFFQRAPGSQKTQMRMKEMACWSTGNLERFGFNPLPTTPPLQTAAALPPDDGPQRSLAASLLDIKRIAT
jgi:hypothetical protein